VSRRRVKERSKPRKQHVDPQRGGTLPPIFGRHRQERSFLGERVKKETGLKSGAYDVGKSLPGKKRRAKNNTVGKNITQNTKQIPKKKEKKKKKKKKKTHVGRARKKGKPSMSTVLKEQGLTKSHKAEHQVLPIPERRRSGGRLSRKDQNRGQLFKKECSRGGMSEKKKRQSSITRVHNHNIAKKKGTRQQRYRENRQ